MADSIEWTRGSCQRPAAVVARRSPATPDRNLGPRDYFAVIHPGTSSSTPADNLSREPRVKRRLVIVTEIIAPYRIPVFNALAARPEVDLHVIFLAETDPGLRQWQVYRDEIEFSYQVLKSYRRRLGRYNVLLTRGVCGALHVSNSDIILCGGYNYLAMWQAQRWARARNIPFLLWSESNIADARRNSWGVEFLKRRFIRACQGYVVPGSSASAYLQTFGVARKKISVAPNAVDVERFSDGAARAREDAELRQRMGLPQRYFLYVGRFTEAKGVFDLLTA